MSTIQFNIDWLHIGVSVVKPFLTLLIWFIADRLIGHLHKHSSLIDTFFQKHSRMINPQRVTTFKGLIIQLIRILCAVFFIFILLGNFGIDPAPVLAAVGVVGLGLSLAAQNILRDFINGMFILIEDQYNVGDWISVNGVEGTVEAFSMRVTRVRRANGDLAIIPNGAISQVANSTKGFSVAVVDAGVSYRTDPRRAFDAMRAAGLAVKDRLGEIILAEPNVLGITAFNESMMNVRMLIRTAPGEQWNVERECRAVIREEFYRAGLEMPMAEIVTHAGRNIE